ncbi:MULTISPECIES: NADP-dependent oxidoreductase [Lysobacter]|uniref:NADP-dependent oxidoreductase n=1 Tax=Lysobacter firmicutimachus TaxID=1792846 RepID=A0ABU8D1M5_9GAMM|nr:NADP-dependent oxidoreductase [Lysobacter antibioticus]
MAAAELRNAVSASIPQVKAVVYDRHGDAEVLRAIDLPMPQAGPGEVRIRVRAAGVRPGDIALRAGRAAAPGGFPRRLGNEFAGVVDQVGSDVGDLKIGDEVLGWAVAMSYAEVLTVPAEQVVHKPPSMSWAVAGALAATGQTALAALRALRLRAGETLLIHGAAGDVGSVAVQLARAWGLRVVGSATPADHDYLRSLGALAIGEDEAGLAQLRAVAPGGVDAVFDALGGAPRPAWLELGAPAQRIVSLRGASRLRRQRLLSLRSERSRAGLTELVGAHLRHGLLVHVREMFPLARAAEAHRAVERGPGRGKVVLMVYQNATTELFA